MQEEIKIEEVKEQEELHFGEECKGCLYYAFCLGLNEDGECSI